MALLEATHFFIFHFGVLLALCFADDICIWELRLSFVPARSVADGVGLIQVWRATVRSCACCFVHQLLAWHQL